MAINLGPIDLVALRDAFVASRCTASNNARRPSGDPCIKPATCRYCGKHWKAYAGSKIDGHAACIVTEDFKQVLYQAIRSSSVSYQAIADAFGVTPSVIRSWTFPLSERRQRPDAVPAGSAS
jgi:hypothetical protein